MDNLLQLALIAYVMVLPGVFVYLSTPSHYETGPRLAFAAAFGLVFVPLVCFVSGWLLRENVSTALVLGVSTAVNLCCVVWWLTRRRLHHRRASDNL